jgi:signal transduction histidine kinase
MASLVESLLYLAKIDYEDKPIFAPLDLGEVLDDVLLPLEPIIHEKNLELQVLSANDVIVNGDKAQLHRLFGILIDNAIKYSNGKISISIDKPAQITVQNSGEAIPPEKLAKLFDRFYRLDEAHEYTGSFGLGLAIAKAIVETHKGKISCKSDEGGTRFVVRW